jgi:hypothetical protein
MRRLSAVEPVIGHLKKEHRMECTAFTIAKVMRNNAIPAVGCQLIL